MKKRLIFDKTPEFLLIATIYVVISVFFLFGLIISSGNVAQGDWNIPLTSGASLNDFNSRLFVWSYGGFGGADFSHWAFPFLPLINAVLSSFGFVGGAEIKFLAVFLVSLGGVTAYLLARSFRLSRFSSFLCGLFFMTTPVVFNWLMFGWIFYILAYALFPLMILITKKFIETNDLRYALINGLILSVATIQPTFILIYPMLSFLFILFESKGTLKTIKRGLTLTAISLSVWFLMVLSFFASYNNSGSFSFYYTAYISAIAAQFSHLFLLINPIRLWGSTFNYQFETYFPQQLIILSFIPVGIALIALLLKPTHKRVLFFFISYLSVFLAYFISINLHYLVLNLPYGVIFEAPSIFLVPASLGLAILIGYTNQTITVLFTKVKKLSSTRLSKNISFVIILTLIVLAGFPWWTGQISGDPIRGTPYKLNLYQIPAGYTTWTNNLNVSQQYFVLYLPSASNAQIANSKYFSETYEGVNSAIFILANNLPYISFSNATSFLNDLMKEPSDIGEHWGSFSIKYIVVYTDVNCSYNMSDILGHLSAQNGIVKVASLPGVVVFEDTLAQPVIYGDNAAQTQIVYQDPTFFKVQANSSAPFTLVLNQMYSTGWKVWVNGTALPDSSHSKDTNGFNNWQINSSGTMNIDIYFEPQTTFLISRIIASGTLIAALFYIVFKSAKGFNRKLSNREQTAQ